MKQEILCGDCKKSLEPVLGSYPGEHYSFVEGEALRDYVCDHCMKAIGPGDTRFCFSIWTDRQVRYNWEPEFVKVK